MKDVGSAFRIEHVRPLEKTRKRLAVLAVADETEPCMRRNVAGNAAHMAAAAMQLEMLSMSQS